MICPPLVGIGLTDMPNIGCARPDPLISQLQLLANGFQLIFTTGLGDHGLLRSGSTRSALEYEFKSYVVSPC